MLSLLLNRSGVCNMVQKKVLAEASRNKTRAQRKDGLEGSKGVRLGMKYTVREVKEKSKQPKLRKQELLEIKKRAKDDEQKPNKNN